MIIFFLIRLKIKRNKDCAVFRKVYTYSLSIVYPYYIIYIIIILFTKRTDNSGQKHRDRRSMIAIFFRWPAHPVYLCKWPRRFFFCQENYSPYWLYTFHNNNNYYYYHHHTSSPTVRFWKMSDDRIYHMNPLPIYCWTDLNVMICHPKAQHNFFLKIRLNRNKKM